ncbi:MAG: hypothetical protein KBT11_00320 [Treponema sp.]|nr:hypothetical protein [Candidatus Treponema equifaecale]
MENNSNFTEQLLPALQSKAEWYDSEGLPEILDNFRLLHTCVKTLYDFLLKKSVITPDPYKLEKKISDITSPESAQFIENERSVIMGQRFSDYESVLDFLCNYYKFSVEHITLQNIKKLVDLANSILWNSFSVNNNRINTRVLATIIFDARQNSDALTASMINDSLSKASHAQTDIISQLKDFSEFQKEYYKGQVRKCVCMAPGYDAAKAAESPASELAMIRKNFSSGMGKVPFYNELIDEIVQEDHAGNKASLQQGVLAKLNIEVKKESKKETKVDTKAMLMDAILVLGATPPQLMQIAQKLQENHDVLESEHNSFMDKLKRAFRKAFGIQEKPLFYTITIVDPHTGSKRNERINYHQFVNDIATKARRYTAAGQKNSAGYQKVYALPEEKILEFVSAQIAECNKMLTLLNAMDEFFKAAASQENKSKIKGLKIDLTTLKNSIVKANQHRAEYTAYVEEEAQMKKLGITQ